MFTRKGMMALVSALCVLTSVAAAEQLAIVRPTLPAPHFNDWEPDGTQSRILELEAKLRALRSQYTDKHPDIVRTRRPLDELLRKQAEPQKAAPPG